MKKHAYLIMAHDQLDQLGNLLAMLDHPRHDLFVHVDSKAGPLDVEAFSAAVQHSLLTFIPRRDIVWGDAAMLECEFDLLEAAGEGYDYLHLLSGQDLPLRAPVQLLEHFDSVPRQEFIHLCPQEEWDAVQFRVRVYHPLLRTRCARTPFGRKALGAMTRIQAAVGINRHRSNDRLFAYGSQWFSITGELAHFVLEQRPWVSRKLRHTLCADELAMQTLALASPFAHRVAGDNLRLVDWARGSAAHPYVWRMDDIETLRGSSSLFARKFDPRVDKEVIAEVSRRVHNSGELV